MMRNRSMFRYPILTNIALAVTCAAVAGWATFAIGRREAGSESIVISTTEQNFGEVWESKTFPWHISVTNSSQSELHIARFETSCGCVSISPAHLTLAAGESRDVNMVLNLTGGRKVQDGLEPREFSLAVTPFEANSYPHDPWFVRGRVRPLFSLSAQAVGWFNGDEIILRSEPEPRVVDVTTPPGVSLQAAAVDPVIDRVETDKLDEEHRYRLTIYPSGDLSLGAFTSNVQLLAYDETGKLLGESPLPVFGEVVGIVAANPRSLELGMRRVGDVTTEVALQSRTGVPFRVTDVRLDGVQLLTPVDPSKRQERCSVQLAQHIQREGNAASRILFDVETDHGEETLEVPIRYRGISERAEKK